MLKTPLSAAVKGLGWPQIGPMLPRRCHVFDTILRVDLPSGTFRHMALSEKLTSLATRFVEEIAAAVREEMLSAMGMDSSAPTPHTLTEARPKRRRSAVAAIPRASKATAAAKRRYPEHCLAKGCKKPHGGPRSGFFCPEHRDKLDVLERKSLQMAWKAAQG